MLWREAASAGAMRASIGGPRGLNKAASSLQQAVVSAERACAAFLAWPAPVAACLFARRVRALGV